MMWHSGQIADTISMSSDSSTPHPVLPAADGSGLVWPFSLTLEKQPVPQAGRPQSGRSVARSGAASGSAKASTAATFAPEQAVVDGRAYALCRLDGPEPSPLGAAS